MSKFLKDTVFTIKLVNFMESDALLTVFGKNLGKFTVLAKGIRKIDSKLRGNIGTALFSDIVVWRISSGFTILKEASVLPISLNSTEMDPILLERILFLLQKLIPENDADDEIFNLLQKMFEFGLSTAVVNRFRVLILQRLGYIENSLDGIEELSKFSYSSNKMSLTLDNFIKDLIDA